MYSLALYILQKSRMVWKQVCDLKYVIFYKITFFLFCGTNT